MNAFSKKVPICTMFLHMALYISPKHLFLTIGTRSIPVFSQVLKPDVPLAVGLVRKEAFAGETSKGSVILSLAKIVGCFQQCRCNRLKLNEDKKFSSPMLLCLPLLLQGLISQIWFNCTEDSAISSGSQSSADAIAQS